MRFRELEKIILNDGWIYKDTVGSHCQYIHPVKSGKVTIPKHTGDISKVVERSALRQTQITRKEGIKL